MFQLQQSLIIYPDANYLSEGSRIRLKDEQIEEISTGEKHIIIITSNRILGIGCNQRGQLGVDDHDEFTGRANFKEYIQINAKFIKSHIKQVSCGWNHTLLLDNLGIVYSAGQGQNGALGHGRGVDSYEFKPIQSTLFPIQWISAGKDHSLALSSTKVYGWGNSQQGQLGLARQQIFYSPQQLLMYASSKCYAGHKYSIFVSQKKQIYVTGWNEGGQLGLGHQRKVKMVKKITGIEEQVVQVSGSSCYSVFKTVKKQYFISGTGCFGKFLYPTKIKQFKNCDLVKMGEKFGFSKDQKGNIYTWDSSKDTSPVSNQIISKLNFRQISVGPKMIVCKILTDHTNYKNWNQNSKQVRRGNKSPTFHKNGMIQSNKDWSNGLNIKQLRTSSIPNSIENRKAISIRMNEEEEADYNPIVILKQKNSIKQDHNQNAHKIQFDQQRNQSQRFNLASPYFKEYLHEQSQNIDQQTERNLDPNIESDDKISGFNPSLRKNVTKSSNFSNQNKQKSCRILNSNYNTTSKTLAKQNCNMQNYTKKGIMEQNNGNQRKCEVLLRIQKLEKENSMKDEYIKNMKSQFLQFLQIMEQNENFKKITSQVSHLKQIFKLKQQFKNEQNCEKNIFFTNLKQIRDLLGAGITSLNHEFS